MNATTADGRAPSTGGKLTSALREAFTNWRLALLGITGLILSLASGWTTWDGMSNFTCPQDKNVFCFAPRVLSFMVTFGIQGIMLIAAWLIGETFAANASSQRAHRSGWFKGGLLAAASLVVIAVFAIVVTSGSIPGFTAGSTIGGIDFTSFAPSVGASSLIVGLIALALILSRREIATPYIDGAKTILRNLPLWIMFLACMATSVFFSFDSLFSTIFPDKDRTRAAKLRVENQVTGMLSDVQARIATRRLEATRDLFVSKPWLEFEKNLGALVTTAEAAPEAVQKQKLERVSRAREATAAVESKLAQSQSEQRRLTIEKTTLEAEIAAAVETRKPAQGTIAEFETALAAKQAEIITAQTAADGERKGVRGTGNAGAGPEYRKLRKVVQNLELDADEITTRLNTARSRLGRINAGVGASQKRLVEIDTRLALLSQDAAAAAQSKAVLEASGKNNIAADLDAAGGVRQLGIARDKFRRAPDVAGLDRLEQLCGSLLANLRSVTSLQTANVNCEPGDASVMANRIFTLSASEEKFGAKCVSGDLPRGTINRFLNFGSSCIQGSGLAGTDTAEFRDKLNRIALNRDDKAHRFVVTWNAFNDGNALAYLALAIAIAIDGLVFMSGLFGANVIRSPLSAVSAERLARTIDTALGEKKYDAAQNTLRVIADNPDAGFGSFKHQIPLAETDDKPDVKKVLKAGIGLDAVKWDSRGDRYLVHADFNTYLNQISDRYFANVAPGYQNDRTEDEIKALLVPSLFNALEPYPNENAEAVLREIEPDSSRNGYMGYISRPSVPRFAKGRQDKSFLQNAINSGTRQGVIDTDLVNGKYFVRPPFFDALTEIRARGGSSSALVAAPTLRVVESQSEHQGLAAQSSPLDAAINPGTARIPSATIALDEQDRRSAIRAAVRQNMAKNFGLDEYMANRLFDDANIAVDTLRNLTGKTGALAAAVVENITNATDRLRSESETIVDSFDAGERDIAEEERDTIALAEAARRTSQMWQNTATTIIDRYHDYEDFSNDDGRFPNRGMETDVELNSLKDQVVKLQSHDRFDNDLIVLITDADNAWVQLEAMLQVRGDDRRRRFN